MTHLNRARGLRRALAVGLVAGLGGLAGCGHDESRMITLNDVERVGQVSSPAGPPPIVRGRKRSRVDRLPRRSIKQVVRERVQTA